MGVGRTRHHWHRFSVGADLAGLLPRQSGLRCRLWPPFRARGSRLTQPRESRECRVPGIDKAVAQQSPTCRIAQPIDDLRFGCWARRRTAVQLPRGGLRTPWVVAGPHLQAALRARGSPIPLAGKIGVLALFWLCFLALTRQFAQKRAATLAWIPAPSFP